MPTLEWIGWVATAVFASSYFWKQPTALRRTQAFAALLWVVYGLAIHAFPVVVANLVVAVAASFSPLWTKPKQANLDTLDMP